MTTTRRIAIGPAALAALAAALLACATLAGAASAAPRALPAGLRAVLAPRIDPGGGHGASNAVSSNWSGYSASGGTYTSVTATWKQRSVVVRKKMTVAAFWVGLDGDGNAAYDSVEQIGTMGYTYRGRVYYAAWFEMFPAPMYQITSVPIRPGDIVTATVRWTAPSSFRLSLKDLTTGRSFARTFTNGRAERASAEVIAEAPSDSSGILPLARFGLATFSGCAVDGGSLADAGASSIDMVSSGGSVIAATSDLNDAGTGFTVTDDFKAPTVTATNLQRTATSGWTNAAVRVKLRGADGTGGSGVAAVYYTVDGGDTQTYSGAFRISDAGSHSVRYWAVDRAGNTGNARTGYVNLDLAAPTSAPEAVSVTRDAALKDSLITVPVTLTDPLPSSGTVTLVTTIVSGSGATVATATRRGVAATTTRTVRVRLTSSLRPDVYTLRTTATDAAGNVQAQAGEAELTVD